MRSHRGFQAPPAIHFRYFDRSGEPVKAAAGLNDHDHERNIWTSPDHQRWCGDCYLRPDEVVSSYSGITPKVELPPTQLLETIDPASVIAYAWSAPEKKSQKKEHA